MNVSTMHDRILNDLVKIGTVSLPFRVKWTYHVQKYFLNTHDMVGKFWLYLPS